MYLVYPRESKEVTARQWTEGKLLRAWVRMDAGGQVTKSLEESASSCLWDGKPWGVWQRRGLVWLTFRRTAEDIHWWLCWVFTDARRLPLGAGRGCSLVAVFGFSCCGAQHLGTQASVVVAHSLQYEESSQIRDRTHVQTTAPPVKSQGLYLLCDRHCPHCFTLINTVSHHHCVK